MQSLTSIQSVATAVSVKGTSMNIWLFLLLLAGVGFLAFCIGFMSGAAAGRFGRRASGGDGKPWWYEQAFPKPDEATVGAMAVLSDRYALGEIDEDEFNVRISALRESSLTADERAKRDAKAAISEHTRDEIRRSLDKQTAKRK